MDKKKVGPHQLLSVSQEYLSEFEANLCLLRVGHCSAVFGSPKLKDAVLTVIGDNFNELLNLFAFICFQFGFAFRDAADLSSTIRVRRR